MTFGDKSDEWQDQADSSLEEDMSFWDEEETELRSTKGGEP